MKAEQILAKLRDLYQQSAERTFERVALASQLLSDRPYLAEKHDGDESLARERIEADYFGDLCGAMTLGQLLDIYACFPLVNQWADLKFNLKALYAQAKEQRRQKELDHRKAEGKEETVRQGPISYAKHQELQKAKEKSDADVRFLQKERLELKQEFSKLQTENESLRRQNAKLEGRVEELERMLDRRALAVA